MKNIILGILIGIVMFHLSIAWKTYISFPKKYAEIEKHQCLESERPDFGWMYDYGFYFYVRCIK